MHRRITDQHWNRRWIAPIALSLVTGAALAQSTVQVIALKYRQAEEVIPTLKPLLGRESSISSFQNQLVVRGTPLEIAHVKRVLTSIDAAPRRLRITVRQDADLERDRREGEVSGSVGGNNARLTVPGSGTRSGSNVALTTGDDNLHARVVDSQQLIRDRTAQTLQVLEGRSAFIQVGESRAVPVEQVTRSVVNGRVVERVIGGTEYRDAHTGFYVLPRVQGDRVTLEINPQRENFNDDRDGSLAVQRVSTMVSGRLGECIEIGGVAQSRSDERTVLLGRSTSRVDDRRGVQVKVEEMQ